MAVVLYCNSHHCVLPKLQWAICDLIIFWLGPAWNIPHQGLDIEGFHISVAPQQLLALLLSSTLGCSTVPLLMGMDWFLCLCMFSVISLTLLALHLKLRAPAHGPREPPRLPVLPLIGSLLSLRSTHPPHVLFKELQGKYGQTYSLMMGSHCVIVVNHHIHAKEVLLKKGKIFAGRSRSVGINASSSSSFKQQ